MNVNKLAGKMEESCDDKISVLSGERLLVYHVSKVNDTYNNKLQTDPVESYVYFVLFHFPHFHNLGVSLIQSLHNVKSVIFHMYCHQVKQFSTKEVRGSSLTSGGGVVKVQLDSGKGNIQSVTVKDNNNG